jgi:hypothetical protein
MNKVAMTRGEARKFLAQHEIGFVLAQFADTHGLDGGQSVTIETRP